MQFASLLSRLGDWFLNHPRPVLGVILALTAFLGYHAGQVKTDHKAGQFLAAESPEVREYVRVGQLFGQGQAVLFVAFREADPHDASFLRGLDSLTAAIRRYTGVQSVLSLTNAPYLTREGSQIRSEPLYEPRFSTEELEQRISSQPFLRGLLLSYDGTTPAMMVTIDPVFNDTGERVDLVSRIQREAGRLSGGVALAGFPYLRTRYAQRVTAEAPLFAALALGLSLALLFLAFGDWRAVMLPTFVVALGTAWTIGLVALFDHRLNVVTSVLPALFVIIGMATTIHLCTAYYDLYGLLQDRRIALRETIRTVGVSTFLACLTTAIGFGVLILSGSSLLSSFGRFAAVGIMLLYVLAIVLIPLTYAHLRPPSRASSIAITHDRVSDAFGRLAAGVRQHQRLIFVAATLISAAGFVGASRISTDLFVFSDFDSSDPLRRDLEFIEEKFGGVLPMEIVIESSQEGSFRSVANLRRIELLGNRIDSLEHVGRVHSAADLVKLANQAYLGGDPRAFRLPSGYELPFLRNALQEFANEPEGNSAIRNLPQFVDSSFSVIRLLLGVDDVGTQRMNQLADSVASGAKAIFNEGDYNVVVTGTAITSTRSGEVLVRNLFVSLAAALLMISVLMAVLFRSTKLTLVSLVPNIIPLIAVAGAMGFFRVTLKPSTALIFSLAFGIAVDASIHFLGKYRLLLRKGMEEEAAILVTMHETGKAIFVSSLVLMAGFLVFTLSSFGGTANMGALTALTLGVALASNLLVLPAMLFRFATRRENKSLTAP